ncbi:hypothetical protein GGD63_005864 [Bradyrhizobium sp. cir1]|uniref:plasmid pRiA4b ORF-3 family protein n=1 Tax=Bradyrhizobium sp. cir1 TaxID=1445730 RepID=UPI00185C7C09|nr:plasmid pRiA4b ORF-3 family protein [Bradyrhizobium sp. cir1]MBB4373049.1 hypothetical protein [Bradyrhizobium sp. cir1]
MAGRPTISSSSWPAKDVGVSLIPMEILALGPLMHRQTRLANIVQETGAKTIHYLYDFGDS